MKVNTVTKTYSTTEIDPNSQLVSNILYEVSGAIVGKFWGGGEGYAEVGTTFHYSTDNIELSTLRNAETLNQLIERCVNFEVFSTGNFQSCNLIELIISWSVGGVDYQIYIDEF